MYRQSINPVYGRNLIAAMLASLGTRPAAALLTTPACSLILSGPSSINQDWAYADFTLVTFGGYLPVTLGALSGPLNLPNGAGTGVSVNAFFAADGTIVAPGQTAIGYLVTGVATAPYIAELFETPCDFAAPGDFLDLSIWFPIANPGPVS